MSRIYPQLNLLREARGSLGKVRPVDLDIGSDNRCRSSLYPFSTITGRNAPKRFPFMPATWTRSFIRPEPGRAIAYCDWVGQELAIAAAFSHDANMMHSYATGDFYLATAKAFGLAPADATAETHAAARSAAKVLSLGLNYGMSAYGLAHRLDIGYAEAEDLVAKHRSAYPNFWAFSDAILDTGMLNSRLTSVFGWSYSVAGSTNPRSLRNWQLQAAGGDMLRLAVVAMVAAGISISAPVHDAVLIEAAETDIAEHVAAAKALMVEASSVVTGGFPPASARGAGDGGRAAKSALRHRRQAELGGDEGRVRAGVHTGSACAPRYGAAGRRAGRAGHAAALAGERPNAEA
jgi:DNA polymerase-1